jgi:hypothetical protein
MVASGNHNEAILDKDVPMGSLSVIGLVVIATSYHKGFYARNDTKLIHRYLSHGGGTSYRNLAYSKNQWASES